MRMQTLATGISTQTKGFTLIELLLVLLIIGIISLIPIINSSFVRGYQEGGPTQINELFNALKQESQLIRKPIAIEENNEKYALVFYEQEFDLGVESKRSSLSGGEYYSLSHWCCYA